METIDGIIKYLPKYFAKILEVWIVWVWFFALDALGLVVDTFVPTFSPPRWLYAVIPGIGFAIANVKLLLDSERRLEAYEYQAPEYELEVTDVSSDVCRMACHVNIYCDVSIKATTPWTGYLVKITVPAENPIRGLGNWEVADVSYRERCNRISRWPLEIPDPVLNLQIKIRAVTSDQIDPSESDKWRCVAFPVNFVIGYFTQPIGDVQKLKTLPVQADLEKHLQTVLEYQRRGANGS